MAEQEPAGDVQMRLAAELAEEVGRLGRELDEIDLLIGQARTEATRHEARRSTAEQRLTELQQARREVSPDDLAQAHAALITATRRAALMEGQIDVLEGKQKTVARMRDRLADVASQLDALPPGSHVPLQATGDRPGAAALGAGGEGGPAHETSDLGVMEAQEELRRGIARAMHDGPAQSLTNITLQAQIVQRLMTSDSARAATEVDQLVAMVEHTLEATKSFIFDVRPMVLDDLGLVPTLRRAARDRGRRANVTIDFDSVGADRRLPDELESALFRCTDEALTGYLSAGATQITLRLDWTDGEVTTRVTAAPGTDLAAVPIEAGAASATPELEPPSADLPPAVAALIAEGAEAARASAERAAPAAAARPAPQLMP
ncbi:MAG: histidine kinase, partial [Candidatus Limnocylindrales bacterium]